MAAWHISPAITRKMEIHDMERFHQDTTDRHEPNDPPGFSETSRSRNTGPTASLAMTTSWTAVASRWVMKLCNTQGLETN